MQDLNDKINGSELPPEEWNEVPSELQNLITSVGQTLSALDLQQVVKAVARYGTSGMFYEIQGSEVANTKNLAPFNDLVPVESYTEGLVVIFNAGVPNTSTSPVINLNGLGNRQCTRTYGSNDPLSAGDLTGVMVMVFDGTRFAISSRKTVETDDIENGAITEDKLNVSVAGDGLGGGGGDALFVKVDNVTIEINSDALRVKDGGITAVKIATNSISTSKIVNNAITTSKILNSAVETAKIDALAVTTAKLAADAVTNDKLANNAVETANIGNNEVTEAKLSVAVQTKLNASVGPGDVGQSELSTSTGNVSTSAADGSSNPKIDGTFVSLPGGAYGFYPQVGGTFVISNGTGSSWGGVTMFSRDGNYNSSPSNAARIGAAAFHYDSGGGGAGGSATVNMTASQRYVTASPPYNIGDGDVANWTFAMANSNGDIIAVYSADVPPWAYNGPTDVRPDRIENIGGGVIKKYKTVPKNMPAPPWLGGDLATWLAWQESPEMEEIEITHSYKNLDMPEFSHPFLDNDLTDMQILLLEPCCSFTDNINEMQNCQGIDTATLLMDGYIELGDEITDCCKPSNEIKVFKPKWKNTGA